MVSPRRPMSTPMCWPDTRRMVASPFLKAVKANSSTPISLKMGVRYSTAACKRGSAAMSSSTSSSETRAGCSASAGAAEASSTGAGAGSATGAGAAAGLTSSTTSGSATVTRTLAGMVRNSLRAGNSSTS